jgi:hypothetical protein
VWLGWQTYLARQQRILVQEVLRLGGTVHYSYQFPNDQLGEYAELRAPHWLRDFLGEDFFTTVIWVHVVETEANDDFMRLLGGAPKLRVLGLWKSKVTDEGLEHLQELPELANVSLGPAATDNSLEILSKLPSLISIWVDSPNVTNAGIEHLRDMQQLELLFLRGTQIGDEALKTIAGLKNLRHLRLVDTNVTPDALCETARALPALDLLEVDPNLSIGPIPTTSPWQPLPGTKVKIRVLSPGVW